MAELKPSAGPLEMGCQTQARIPGRWEKIILARRRRVARPLASLQPRKASSKARAAEGVAEAPEGAQLLLQGPSDAGLELRSRSSWRSSRRRPRCSRSKP
jgi:hypothetical protein